MRIIIACAALISATVSVFAEGALGTGTRNGVEIRGYSINFATRDEAANDVLRQCRQSGLANCRVDATFRRSCINLVTSPFVRNTPFTDDELRMVMEQCRNRGLACNVTQRICDTVDEEENRRAREAFSVEQSSPPVTIYAPTTPAWRERVHEVQKSLPSYLPEALAPYSGFVNVLLVFALVGSGLFISEKLYRLIRAGTPAIAPAFTTLSAPASQHQEPATTPPPPPGSIGLQATISHSQERSGFYVALTLLFSPDALQLIKGRRLEKMIVVTAPTKPPVTAAKAYGLFYGTYAFGYAAVPIVFIAIVAGFLGHSDVAFVVIIVTIGVYLWGFSGGVRKQIDSHDDRNFTIADFFRQPTVKFWAPNPVAAKVLDSEIRENLQKLRMFLDESVHLPQSDTFNV